ncbi:MAG: hypothetical protein LBL16_05155 [Endomicrobium sp.]|nr:hypothetical protein [Endomicrobium sp.]
MIDDFHYIHQKTTKEKMIEELSKFEKSILFVDGIFGIDFLNAPLISSYSQFKIRELSSNQRFELIKKMA